ncbi:unnamed protein product [Polarella glacialis]|uniref:Uncharacterized protein n=1 Tax=Polarella glacialis TaxID=89957 RepID=A0A813K2R3_POLGL|nr:unnamed protein product [Polarella glacialis]CAE8695510.1 unnamed protein product [Polarella glacialis]
MPAIRASCGQQLLQRQFAAHRGIRSSVAGLQRQGQGQGGDTAARSVRRLNSSLNVYRAGLKGFCSSSDAGQHGSLPAAATRESSSTSANRRGAQVALNRRLREGSFQEFLDLSKEEADSMDLANIVICLGRVVRKLEGAQNVRVRHDVSTGQEEACFILVSKLLGRCIGVEDPGLVLSTRSGHSLANLAWAAARLEDRLPSCESEANSLPQTVSRLVLHKGLQLGLENLKGRDLPVLVWAIAWVQRNSHGCLLGAQELRDVFRALSSSLPLRLPEVAPQGLAMLLWSLATLEASPLPPCIPQKPSDQAGQVTIAGPGSSPPVPRAVFRAVAEETGRRSGNLSAREVANVAWSFATVQVTMPDWLLEDVPRRALQLSPQECANVLWALASASQLDAVEAVAGALHAGGAVAATSFEGWKPQEMANAAWALAHACQRSRSQSPRDSVKRGSAGGQSTLEVLHSPVVPRVHELGSVELAMVASSLRHGEAPSAELRDRIAVHASELMAAGCLTPDAIVQVADSITAAGQSPPEELRTAAESLWQQTLQILKGLVRDRPESLQALGLTSLGGQGTVRLLQDLGIMANHSSDASDLMHNGKQYADWNRLDVPQTTAGQVLCLLRYHLLLTVSEPTHKHLSLMETGRVISSGSEPDTTGLGLLTPVTLRFSRGRDAEFLALTSIVGEATRRAGGGKSETWQLRGSIDLHVSHTPCLSCVGAMVQFRNAFPEVRLEVTFD